MMLSLCHRSLGDRVIRALQICISCSDLTIVISGMRALKRIFTTPAYRSLCGSMLYYVMRTLEYSCLSSLRTASPR